MTIPPVTKSKNSDDVTEYYLEFDSAWDGLDSFIKYLQKYWNAEIIESDDKVYSRRWVLRSEDVSISVYHDSQKGNYFLREDGIVDQSLLDRIESDLIRRMQ